MHNLAQLCWTTRIIGSQCSCYSFGHVYSCDLSGSHNDNSGLPCCLLFLRISYLHYIPSAISCHSPCRCMTKPHFVRTCCHVHSFTPGSLSGCSCHSALSNCFGGNTPLLHKPATEHNMISSAIVALLQHVAAVTCALRCTPLHCTCGRLSGNCLSCSHPCAGCHTYYQCGTIDRSAHALCQGQHS